MCRSCLLLLAMLLPVLAVAQPHAPEVLWTRIFDQSPVLAQGMDVCPLADGGFMLTAWVQPADTLSDTRLLRTDAGGSMLWNRTYGCTSQMWMTPVVAGMMPNGGFLLYGVGNVPGSSLESSILLRTSADGDSEWCRAYGIPVSVCSVPEGNRMLLTRDGGTLLSRWGGDDTRMLHAFLMRTSSAGDTLWTKELCSHSDFRVLNLSEREEGGFTVTGERVTYPWAGLSEICAIKLSSTGDSTGAACGNITDSYVRCLQGEPTADGGWLLTGFRSDSAWTYGNYWAAHLNANLETLWSRTYGGHSPGECSGGSNDCALLDDGGALLAGGGRVDVLRISSTGDSLWSLDFDSVGMSFNRVRRTGDGGFILTGLQYVSAHDTTKVVLVRLAAESEAVSGERRATQGRDYALAAYPNPFNPATQIVFTLPQSGRVQISVFDVTGRRVRTLADGQFSAGEHRMIFDGSELTSGVYFARLSSGSVNKTEKLLLLK